MNRKVDNILISVAATGVLLFIKHFIGSQPILYSGIMIAVGLFVLLFGERILDGQPSPIKSFFINTAGILVLVGGVGFLMEHFNAQYWWVFGIVGIVIYNFHHLISERL
jgi:hypothetical protein